MAPTLAKFLPDDLDDWYMSRRPCLSCWRSGRSVRGTEGPGAVTAGGGAVGVGTAGRGVVVRVEGDAVVVVVGGVVGFAAAAVVLVVVVVAAAAGGV